MTNFTYNISTELSNDEHKHSVFANDIVFGYMALFVALPSAAVNLFLFLVLQLTPSNINPASLILLQSQLIFDGLACVCLIMGQMAVPDTFTNDFLFYMKCVVLVQSAPMWFFYTASVYNIVAVAIQRFVITVFPFRSISKAVSYAMLAVVVFGALLANGINYGIELSIDPKLRRCVYLYESEPAIFLWGFQYYFIPFILIICLYAKSFFTLKSRGGIKKNTSKRSESLMLKNAVVIATLFIVLCGPNSLAYILVYFKLINLAFYNATFKYVSWVCTMFNSASTPLVYLLFLKSLRQQSAHVLRALMTCSARSLSNRVGDSSSTA